MFSFMRNVTDPDQIREALPYLLADAPLDASHDEMREQLELRAQERVEIALNVHTPADVLAQMIADDDMRVLRAVALNPNSPAFVRRWTRMQLAAVRIH